MKTKQIAQLESIPRKVLKLIDTSFNCTWDSNDSNQSPQPIFPTNASILS